MTQIRLLCCWAITFIFIVSAFVFDHARLVELASVDHVGLGTDMDSNFKPVFSRYLQMPNWRKGLIKKISLMSKYQRSLSVMLKDCSPKF